MAQTQTVTNEGITEFVLLMSGGTATEVESIVCLDDTGTCTAAVASTFSDPAGTAVHHTGSGLQLVNADTVSQSTTNTTNDTIEVDHVFTASATEDVVGFHVCNNDDDVCFMECCFNAVIAMENTDTLTIEAKMVLDQA
jgi:hypothetical protein